MATDKSGSRAKKKAETKEIILEGLNELNNKPKLPVSKTELGSDHKSFIPKEIIPVLEQEIYQN